MFFKKSILIFIFCLIFSLCIFFKSYYYNYPIKSHIKYLDKSTTNLKTKTEVINILNDNISWSFLRGSLYKWPSPKDAINSFNQLNELDISILIEIIRNNEDGKAQVHLAGWVLSMFGDKAKEQILSLSENDKEKFKTILELIEFNKK